MSQFLEYYGIKNIMVPRDTFIKIIDNLKKVFQFNMTCKLLCGISFK